MVKRQPTTAQLGSEARRMRRPSCRARSLGIESLEGRRLLSATQGTDVAWDDVALRSDASSSADAAGGASSLVGTGIYRQLAVVTKTRLESWESKRATEADGNDSLQHQTATYPQWAPYARYSPGQVESFADADDDRLASDESDRREFFRIAFDLTSRGEMDEFDLHLLGPNQIVDVSALPTAGGTLRFSQNVFLEGTKCCPARRGDQEWGQVKVGDWENSSGTGDREMTLSAPLDDRVTEVSRPESMPSTETPPMNTGTGNGSAVSEGGGEMSLESPIVSSGNQGVANAIDGTSVGLETNAGVLTGAGDRTETLGYAESMGHPAIDVIAEVIGSIDTNSTSTIILGTPGLAIDSVDRAGAGAAVESSFSEGGFVELDLSSSLRESDLNAQILARRSSERLDAASATPSSSDLVESFPRTLGLFELGLNEATPSAASLTERQQAVPSLSRDDSASANNAANDPVIVGDDLGINSTTHHDVTSKTNSLELNAATEIDLTAVANETQAEALVDRVLTQRLDDLLGTDSHEFIADDLAEIVGAQVASTDPNANATLGDMSDRQLPIMFAHYSAGGMIELANDSTANSSVPVRPIQLSGRPLGIDGSIGLLRGVELSIAGLDNARSATQLVAATTSDVFDRLDQLTTSHAQDNNTQNSANITPPVDDWATTESGRSNEGGANLAHLRRWAQWGMLAAVPALIWGHRRRSGSNKQPRVHASSGVARRKREA